MHEWLAAYAGSEQVFEAIAQEFPSADLYALSRTPNLALGVGGRDITCTFLNRPRLRDRRQATLPIMPIAWKTLTDRRYDLVISSVHAFAHTNNLAAPTGKHLAYVHSPARYLWSPEIDGRGSSKWLLPAVATLRGVDQQAAQKLHAVAANSAAVAARVRRFWNRDATVIHPPVRVRYFAERRRLESGSYVLGVGRWIPYKNFDLVIRAAARAGMPVKIAGAGPDEARLRALAASSTTDVEFVAAPNDERLRELYANAACLVFPTVEDFGIVPVEAQATGTPVVAPSVGGALDTVVDGKTGVLVNGLEPEALAEGIHAAQALDRADCSEHAERFGRETFRNALHSWIAQALTRH